jgi:hypothetical protein
MGSCSIAFLNFQDFSKLRPGMCTARLLTSITHEAYLVYVKSRKSENFSKSLIFYNSGFIEGFIVHEKASRDDRRLAAQYARLLTAMANCSLYIVSLGWRIVAAAL